MIHKNKKMVMIMILDSCINTTLRQNFEVLYKARVLTAIIFVYFSIISAVDIWLIFSQHIHGLGLVAALLICGSMQSAYICALLLLKYKGLFQLVAHFTIALTAIGIAGGIAVSGGPLTAPATPMNILPITMAFVLINKRAGLIWTQIILAAHMSFMALQAHGFNFPQMLPEQIMELQHMAHWLIIYSAMIGLMVVYDSLNNRLKTELNAERNKFQHMASHDPLTNLANRLQFDENLKKSLSRSDRYGKSTALFFLDLDGFKPINDSLGHDAGDIVLQEISRRLQSNVRELDTVARLGGDEFGIILEDINDSTKLEKIADKLLAIISKPITTLKNDPIVTGSIGIAIYPNHCKQKDELVKHADLAMYKAKEKHNGWVLYYDELNTDA